ADVHRFTKLLFARRAMRSSAADKQRLSLIELLRQATFAWHGVNLWHPDWAPCSHALALGADIREAGLRTHLITNAYWEPLEFELPPPGGSQVWRRWIDTSLDTPNDIVTWDDAPIFTGRTYSAGPRSVVVLWSPLA